MTINNFIDKCFEPYQLHIKELEQSLENLTVTYETLKLHDDEEISSLQAQIEKMKCCGNCKYSAQETVYSIVCKVGGVNKGEIENVEDCLVCDKWEIKENE